MNYPAIFSNVADVMDHLFLTVGNGYEWVNGELIDKSDNIPNLQSAFDKLKHNNIDNTNTDRLVYSIIKDLLNHPSLDMLNDTYNRIIKIRHKEINRLVEHSYQIANVDEILLKPLQLEATYDLYPLSEYSCIMNIPDDITDDWKQCIKRFYDWIMSSEFSFIVEWRNKYGGMLKIIEDKLV